MDLTDHQQEELDALNQAGMAGERELTLSGCAGTGKTTLIGHMGTQCVRNGPWNDVVYITTTGRAKVVLSRKVQSDVHTFHAFTYGKAEEEMKHAHDDSGNPMYDDADEPVMVRTGKLLFGQARQDMPANTLVVCDEASMVNRIPMHRDLMQALPMSSAVCYVGDGEQLPPVKGDAAPNFVNPTAHLEEIHRQAWDNPVIRLATAIRKSEDPDIDWRDPRTQWSDYGETNPSRWLYDHIQEGRDATLITGTNKVRGRINDKVRGLLGHEDILVPGERMVALQNDHSRQLMNGEIYTAEKIYETRLPQLSNAWVYIVFREEDPIPMILQHGTIGTNSGGWGKFRDHLYANFRGRGGGGRNLVDWLLKFLRDSGEGYAAMKLEARTKVFDIDYGLRDATSSEMNDLARSLFSWSDYGYCLTIHKSQGSEWDNVGIVFSGWIMNHRDKVFSRRAQYTAVTRTRENLHIWA